MSILHAIETAKELIQAIRDLTAAIREHTEANK